MDVSMRNSCTASSEARMFVPPRAVVPGVWPDPASPGGPPPDEPIPVFALTPSTTK